MALILVALATAGAARAADAPSPTQPNNAPRENRGISASSWLARGLAMVDRPRPEDQDEARRLLRKALEADSTLAAAHVGLARSSIYLYALGLDETADRLKTALDEARRAVDIAPDDPAARATLAVALATSDALTPALEQARRAVELGPGAAPGHLALCVIERLRGDLETALAECHRAAAIEPDSPRVLVALGAALRESGDRGAAMEMYGQAADLDHESALPQLGGAAALVQSGNIRTASIAYDTVLEKFAYARRRALQGAAAMRALAGDYEGAIDLLDQFTLPDTSSLPTLLSLYTRGWCLLKLGRAAEAEYFLSTLIGRVPTDYDGPSRGRDILFRAYDDLADYFEGRGRPERVEALLREAAARPLAPVRIGRRLAGLLESAGAKDEAAVVLERALMRADPGDDPLQVAAAALSLARLRSRDGRRAVRPGSPAGQALDQALSRVGPEAPGTAHYSLARAFALAHDADRGMACLERARDAGYFPAGKAALEPDFAYLRDRPEFRSLLAAATPGSRAD